MKIRNIYLLITLAFTAQSNTALSMNIIKGVISGLCSFTELFITSTPILGTILDQTHPQPIEKLTDTQSMPPQIVTDYITSIATERGINNAQIIMDSKCEQYSKDAYDPIVYVNPKEASELELLLQNSNRTAEEQKTLHRHIGDIYHEWEHHLRNSEHCFRVYKAITGTIGAIATSATLSHLIKKYIPAIKKNFLLYNSFKMARSGLTCWLTCKLAHSKITYLDNLYHHYDELQADKGIPNKRELLEPQAELYETAHNNLMKYIQKTKETACYTDIISPAPEYHANRFELFAIKTLPIKWFNNPYIMNATLYAKIKHPSDIQRALCFRKRIKDIDQTITTNQNI